jgi:hypothetical protein
MVIFKRLHTKNLPNRRFFTGGFLVYGPMVKVSGVLDDFNVNIDGLFFKVCNQFCNVS